MIEIQNVSKRFGTRTALDGVTFTVPPGEITLLLGANGAGKSTLLRCLLGITSYEGTIRVAGRDPLADGRAVRGCIGYMPQTGGLHPDLTVEETLGFYADIRRAPRDRCAPLLEESGLTAHRTARVGELSGGLRQRLGFAIALLTDPAILVLDEPSASLDTASRRWLAERLRASADQGRTVLVSTHAGQELLAVSDRQLTLEDGRPHFDLASTALRPHPDRTSPPLRPHSDTGRSAVEVRSKPGRSAVEARSKCGRSKPLMVKELRDALRSRWLLGYAGILGALGFAATATGLESTSGMAIQAFGRTTATLMNLCLLLSPLVAVLMGAGAIAGEQERGTLEHLLAQPLSRTELLLAKHLGLLIALTAATLAGFLPAGVLIAASAGPGVLGHYLLFPAIAALAGAAMAGVGLLISVSSRSAVQAQGTAVFAWFAFVLLYDLALMGSLAVAGLPAAWLTGALVLNPVDAARVLGVLALEPDLYLLGPAGALLTATFGQGGAAGLLLGALVTWAIAPMAAAAITFSHSLRRTSRAKDENRIRAAAQRRSVDGGDCVRVGNRVA